MIFSTNFSTRAAVFLLAAMITVAGCAVKSEPPPVRTALAPSIPKGLKFAVYPVINISGTPAPLPIINQSLLDSLHQNQLNILAPDVVESVLQKHRIRYLGGLDRRTSRAFREEARADAVLITSLELYSDNAPPKIALSSRLVSTTEGTQILWMGGTGLAGDDSPGLLDLSLIEDPGTLLEMAMRNLVTSLAQYISGQPDRADDQETRTKFEPKTTFRSDILDQDLAYTVAVLPFFNLSERKFAGDMIALNFIKSLRKSHNFYVIEPGVVRQALLDMRVIMMDGLSLANADLVFGRLNADLILAGKIIDYQDYRGLAGKPKVDFSAQLFERKSREVVWAVQSYNQGDDGVFFFDWGRVNTAYEMATQMVQLAVEEMVAPE